MREYFRSSAITLIAVACLLMPAILSAARLERCRSGPNERGGGCSRAQQQRSQRRQRCQPNPGRATGQERYPDHIRS